MTARDLIDAALEEGTPILRQQVLAQCAIATALVELAEVQRPPRVVLNLNADADDDEVIARTMQAMTEPPG